jgi:hydroxyacylglutathione hydrolase
MIPRSTYVADSPFELSKASADSPVLQPGHLYTKANVKFCLHVSQTEPIKKLQAFAEANQQTQGKFTIGDEKVCCSWP